MGPLWQILAGKTTKKHSILPKWRAKHAINERQSPQTGWVAVGCITELAGLLNLMQCNEKLTLTQRQNRKEHRKRAVSARKYSPFHCYFHLGKPANLMRG